MAYYYYLISSLPTLKTDAPVPFTYDYFLQQCKSFVSSSVYENLEKLTLLSSRGPFLKQWGAFYNEMTYQLNRRRREKFGRTIERTENMVPENSVSEKAFSENPSSVQFSVQYSVKICIDNVMKEENPLVAENLMLNEQFLFIDSLTVNHFFDIYVLYAYAVKLKLLERKGLFTTERGSSEFKRLLDNIKEQVEDL